VIVVLKKESYRVEMGWRRLVLENSETKCIKMIKINDKKEKKKKEKKKREKDENKYKF